MLVQIGELIFRVCENTSGRFVCHSRAADGGGEKASEWGKKAYEALTPKIQASQPGRLLKKC